MWMKTLTSKITLMHHSAAEKLLGNTKKILDAIQYHLYIVSNYSYLAGRSEFVEFRVG